MKKLTLIVITLASLNIVNAQWGKKTIKGNGNITTVSRSTSQYDIINCAGWMDFVLIKGEEGNIKIEGEENLLEYIITETKDNKLYIKTKNGVNLKTSKNKTVTITIPFKDIDKVSLSGSGDVITKDKILANNFEVKIAGSGDIILDVDASYINAGISGSGDITLKGNTEDLKASVTGSGDFHGFNLQANNTEAVVIGSGDVMVVSNNKLKARVTGSGDIEYKGNPKYEDSRITGSGSISK